jgi:phage shock protein A
MSFFKRLMRVIKANLNALISRAEKPDKINEQVLQEMQEQLQEAQNQVARAIADEKNIKKQLNEALQQSDTWEKRAMRAIEAGDDDLARQALVRKDEQDKIAAEYQKQWEAQKQAVDQLKNALTMLRQKIDEAKRKKNLLIARQKRAEAQKMIQETMSGIADHSAFDTMDRMSKKIDEIEAQAEAQTEINRELTDQSLEEKFRKLETTGPAQDDALAALKAKMGVMPAKLERETEAKGERVREKMGVSRDDENW